MLLLLFNNLRGTLITECAPFFLPFTSYLLPVPYIPHFLKFKL
nr:MAG TPA: hypothetical protein [Caudoviricetes sp.]